MQCVFKLKTMGLSCKNSNLIPHLLFKSLILPIQRDIAVSNADHTILLNVSKCLKENTDHSESLRQYTGLMLSSYFHEGVRVTPTVQCLSHGNMASSYVQASPLM